MNLKVSDAKREEGFTLIELLVVVIIIGILAAIAIPVFLNQRERAWERTAESDVRNAAIEVESFFNDEFLYPTPDEFTALITAGDIQLSPNVVLAYVRSTPDGSAYSVAACHVLVDGCGAADDTVAIIAWADDEATIPVIDTTDNLTALYVSNEGGIQ